MQPLLPPSRRASIQAPILVLAYNRPEKIKDLIDSLRPHRPETLIFNIDGPKNATKNLGQTAQDFSVLIRQEIAKIDWPCALEIRAHPKNQGIRIAIPEAVTYVLTKFSRVIVLEEDVEVGPQAIEFANQMLQKFDSDSTVGHISLYNIVPAAVLEIQTGPARLSRYPESVAWATWASKWRQYGDDVPPSDLSRLRVLWGIVKNLWEALSWLLVFRDVRNQRISSWAYRWVSSLWSSGMFCISPNVNLVTYKGFDEGSHTRFRAPWTELPLGKIDLSKDFQPSFNFQGDAWLSKRIFGGSIGAFGLKIVSSLLLRFVKDRT
jgi:hypothetical protein